MLCREFQDQIRVCAHRKREKRIGHEKVEEDNRRNAESETPNARLYTSHHNTDIPLISISMIDLLFLSLSLSLSHHMTSHTSRRRRTMDLFFLFRYFSLSQGIFFFIFPTCFDDIFISHQKRKKSKFLENFSYCSMRNDRLHQ